MDHLSMEKSHVSTEYGPCNWSWQRYGGEVSKLWCDVPAAAEVVLGPAVEGCNWNAAP